MATYFIPTDYSGGTILVNEGDIFIFEATASNNVRFESATGTATNFEVQFSTTNTNAFTVEIKDNLNANISIANDVDLGSLLVPITAQIPSTSATISPPATTSRRGMATTISGLVRTLVAARNSIPAAATIQSLAMIRVPISPMLKRSFIQMALSRGPPEMT